jgi:hypothetical protein
MLLQAHIVACLLIFEEAVKLAIDLTPVTAQTTIHMHKRTVDDGAGLQLHCVGALPSLHGGCRGSSG